MKKLYRRHFNDLEGYCTHKCTKLMNEYKSVQVWYYRGQYKGYIYVIKLMRKTKPSYSDSSVPFYVVYNHLKQAKTTIIKQYHKEAEYINGIKHSLYDCINYLNEMDINT